MSEAPPTADQSSSTLQVVIDGQAWNKTIEKGQNMAHLFVQIDQFLRDQERVVLGVILDGKTLSIAEQEQITEKACDDYQCLEVQTESNQHLAAQSVEEIIKIFPALRQETVEVSRLIQIGKTQDAMKLLAPVLQVWAVMFQVIEDAGKFHNFKVSEVKVQGHLVQDHLVALARNLREIQDALKRKDLITVGDVLEYETVPALDTWENIVLAVVENIPSQAA